MHADPARSRTIRDLAAQLRKLERSHRHAPGTGKLLPTGLEPLDKLLPESGFRRGTLVDWIAEAEGGGTTTLALLVAARLLQSDGTLVVLDPQTAFHPPAAERLGIDLTRTIVVRPEEPADTLWALEQSLRCPGVTIVLAPLPRIADGVARRLQLAAEAGDTLGLLLRSGDVHTTACWADLRLAVRPLPRDDLSAGRHLRVDLLHGRGQLHGGNVELEIDDDTGALRPAAGVAPATPPRRAAGA